jgi:hypothetical protein
MIVNPRGSLLPITELLAGNPEGPLSEVHRTRAAWSIISLRVSTLDPTTANHEHELREIASRMDCEIVKVYRDADMGAQLTGSALN